MSSYGSRQNQPVLEGGTALTPDEIGDIVLGIKSGYICGLGHGPKPKKSVKSSQNLEVQEAMRRADEAEKVQQELLERVETQNQMIKSQQTQLEEMSARQTQFEHMFQAFMSSGGHPPATPTS